MASENVTKAVSLKDYIIDMKSATVKGVTQYEVVLENNTDDMPGTGDPGEQGPLLH